MGISTSFPLVYGLSAFFLCDTVGVESVRALT
jgi:hypothetical protein